jgi:GNAT superfamily N-acetyltransferase
VTTRLAPGLHTRPPTSADGAALRDLLAACHASYRSWAPAGWPVPRTAADWSARLREPERWSLCAFAGDGALAAYVAFRPARRDETPSGAGGPPLAGVAHLAALYVHPSRWRQGIATAMLAQAEAAMHKRAYGAAQLWTPAGAPAERFYLARGWRRDGRSGWDGWLGLEMVGYATRL